MKQLQYYAQSFVTPAGLSIMDKAYIKQCNICLYKNVNPLRKRRQSLCVSRLHAKSRQSRGQLFWALGRFYIGFSFDLEPFSYGRGASTLFLLTFGIKKQQQQQKNINLYSHLVIKLTASAIHVCDHHCWVITVLTRANLSWRGNSFYFLKRTGKKNDRER